MAEIYSDKAVKNLTIKNNKPSFLTIDNKNLFVFDYKSESFQIDEKYLEYALTRLRVNESNKYGFDGYAEKNSYINKTNDSYFDIPYFKRNEKR
jgi:hypothetical protein